MITFLQEFRHKYFLVGGTAIALQIGHRESIDFDLFASSTNELDRESIDRVLVQYGFEYQTLIDTTYHLEILIQGVRITRYAYPYSLHQGENSLEGVPMPSLLQLCAMKLHAVQRRAKRKDYIDLSVLLPLLGSYQAIQYAQQMLGGSFSSKLVSSQLVYIDDVDFSEAVIAVPPYSFDKDTVLSILKEISKKILTV